jgi:hypothetical protein
MLASLFFCAALLGVMRLCAARARTPHCIKFTPQSKTGPQTRRRPLNPPAGVSTSVNHIGAGGALRDAARRGRHPGGTAPVIPPVTHTQPFAAHRPRKGVGWVRSFRLRGCYPVLPMAGRRVRGPPLYRWAITPSSSVALPRPSERVQRSRIHQRGHQCGPSAAIRRSINGLAAMAMPSTISDGPGQGSP